MPSSSTMKTGKYMTFQGDVDIVAVDTIPETAKQLDTKTVMYGEETGHHHTFTGTGTAQQAATVILYEPTKGDTLTVRDNEEAAVQKYVHVLKDTVLEHQEHAKQVIPKGMYAILQEREWDPLQQQLRRVID